MESCLLCLETPSDTKDSIKNDSVEWQKLEIANVLEKHFWPVNYSLPSSFICISCWQTVHDFHSFYVRIEEAHMNFGKVKVEEEPMELFYIQETDTSLTENFQMQFNGEAHQELNTNFNALETMFGEENSRDLINEMKTEPTEMNYEDTQNEADNDTYSESEQSDDDDNSSNTNKKKTDKEFAARYVNNDQFIAENFKNIKCDLCQKPLTNFHEVKHHYPKEHNQRGYVACCKRKFYDRFHLVDHIHLHLDPNYFKCNHCGKTMSNRRTIKNHILNEHLKNAQEKKHSCDRCDVSFNDEYILLLHKSEHLPDNEKKFPCNNCSETYTSFHPLLQHMKAEHSKKFFKNCYACGKTLVCARDFEVHVNKHLDRSVTKIYCDVCGLGLANEDCLKRHQRDQHPVGGKKDYHCPNCPKISPTHRALQKHIRTVHGAKLSFECELCGKSFKRKVVLKEHMAIHTGNPLYTCIWCPKQFKSSSNMFAHRKKVHPKEWEKAKLQKYSKEFQQIIAKTAQKKKS